MTSAGTDQVGRRFAANLRRHRKAAGLTQEELAFIAGIHRTQIGLLEGSGNRLPRLITFIKLGGALGVSADVLLEGIDFEPYVLIGSGGLRVTEPEEQP